MKFILFLPILSHLFFQIGETKTNERLQARWVHPDIQDISSSVERRSRSYGVQDGSSDDKLDDPSTGVLRRRTPKKPPKGHGNGHDKPGNDHGNGHNKPPKDQDQDKGKCKDTFKKPPKSKSKNKCDNKDTKDNKDDSKGKPKGNRKTKGNHKPKGKRDKKKPPKGKGGAKGTNTATCNAAGGGKMVANAEDCRAAAGHAAKKGLACVKFKSCAVMTRTVNEKNNVKKAKALKDAPEAEAEYSFENMLSNECDVECPTPCKKWPGKKNSPNNNLEWSFLFFNQLEKASSPQACDDEIFNALQGAPV